MKTRYNKADLLLILFVVLSENGLYLINIDLLNIAGSFNYNDMWIILLLFYEIYYFSKYKMYKKYTYKVEIAGSIICCGISSFQSSYNFGQPFMMGFRPQRFFILCILIYFPVRKLLALKKINAVNILNLLVVMGTIEGILCAAQYFVSSHVIFLHVLSNTRYGSIRLYFDSGLIMLTTILGWCFFLKKGNFKYLITVGVGMIYEFLISKGRLENICILFSLCLAYILLRKAAFRKVMILLTLVSSFVLLINTSYSEVLIDSVKSFITGTDDSEQSNEDGAGDTMAIRKEGRQHYSEQINSSNRNRMFGCGYPNNLYEKAVEYANIDVYFLNDNGIFAYIYVYGILGIVFILFIVIKAVIQSIKLYIKKDSLFPLSYMAFLVPLSYNIIFWWWKWDSTLLLAIYLAIIDHYVYDKYREDEYVL